MTPLEQFWLAFLVLFAMLVPFAWLLHTITQEANNCQRKTIELETELKKARGES